MDSDPLPDPGAVGHERAHDHRLARSSPRARIAQSDRRSLRITSVRAPAGAAHRDCLHTTAHLAPKTIRDARAPAEPADQAPVSSGVAVSPGGSHREPQNHHVERLSSSTRLPAQLCLPAPLPPRRPMGIGMLGEDAPVRCIADSRALGRESGRAGAPTTSSPLRATRISPFGSRNSSMPSHASVIRHAPAPAASKTRVAGEKP